MGTTRHSIRRPRRGELSFTQMQEMWLGPNHHGSTFKSDEHRRRMWFKPSNHEKIMRLWAKGGRRPQAWWRYEAPYGLRRRYPGYAYERSTLWEAGVLGEAERIQLEREWRVEFEKVFAPDFCFYTGGKILTGFKASVEHLLFHDLPPQLVDRWERERERRGQIIRRLEQESAPKSETNNLLDSDLGAA